MTEDTAARKAFVPLVCPFCGSDRLAVHPDHAAECFACGAIGPGMSPEPWNTRSIPAAAALLRANGWRVEEPKCETCSGTGCTEHGFLDCQPCNGTGKRKGTGHE